MNWLKKHWKAIASFGCGVAAVVVAPLSAPAAVGVALACSVLGGAAGKEYEAGKALGGIVKPVTDKLRK